MERLTFGAIQAKPINTDSTVVVETPSSFDLGKTKENTSPTPETKPITSPVAPKTVEEKPDDKSITPSPLEGAIAYLEANPDKLTEFFTGLKAVIDKPPKTE